MKFKSIITEVFETAENELVKEKLKDVFDEIICKGRTYIGVVVQELPLPKGSLGVFEAVKQEFPHATKEGADFFPMGRKTRYRLFFKVNTLL